MITGSGSWGAETFDRLYAASDDPWALATSAYERAKYAATLHALGGRQFSAGLEAGCSIGVLTKALARRCARLLAVDISEEAVRLAKDRCAGQDNITFAKAGLPGDWPTGERFDLLVFSEILYFLDEPDLRATARLAREHLLPGGLVLSVNWIGGTDTPLTGEAAADLFVAGLELAQRRTVRCAFYRLDILCGEPL